MSNTTNTTANKPAFESRLGQIKVTVWANKKDGKLLYSTSITKSYKDKETGDWKESSSYSRDDLPKIQELTRQAYVFICTPKSH